MKRVSFDPAAMNGGVDKPIDESRSLRCAVVGCMNRWTVSLDRGDSARGMCSRHAWGSPGLHNDSKPVSAVL